MSAQHTLWFDPSFGASGDMLLGALVGLGADPAALRAALSTLPVGGWQLDVGETTRCGLGATRVEVRCDDHGHAHRPWHEIDAMLARADGLPERVLDGARRTFRRLGEIEAAAHDVPIEEVHFHEVGAVDAIVDIVGVWVCIDLLGIGAVVSGPVGLGHGTIRVAHGVMPLPAPATAALLAGAPVRSLDVEMETCTPTGAALLATVGGWGPVPDGVLVAGARGAGGCDPAGHPNVVTAHLLRAEPVDAARATAAVLLETNVDDVTPEVIGHVIERLLADGADDAWAVPIVMKKSRPAFELRVLCSPTVSATMRRILGEETGTLGIRELAVTKHVQPRHVDEVEIDGMTVRVKVGPHGAKPEHDDVVAVATATGRPLRAVAAEAMARHADS